jgi:murein DD-endopeptidase MepM/ murein hydrolase activator NlpD
MDNVKLQILPYSHRAIDRPLQHRWAAAAVGGFALLGMVAAFAVAPAADHSRADLQKVLEQLSPPTPMLLEAGDDPFLREERVRRSDTPASLLIRLGVTDRDALHFLRTDRQGRRLAQQLRPGATVTARSGAGGELHTLSVPLTGKDALLVIKRRGKDFVIREQAMEMAAQTVVRSAEITNSWVGATDAAGIPDSVASQLIAIFGSEIDFHRDLRNGDRFSLVYEIFNHDGQTVRHGRILAAEIRSNQRVLQAFWFQPEQSGGAYYTADGYSHRRTFLRSPIEPAQVNSGFSGERLHPILQTWRAHKGVDYAAPSGTPVLAVADGIIETAEYQNNGYGNLIVIKHHGTYASAYGHLSHFAAGLRKDTRVRQGDTIGYVGQTGLATGPHLHYEFRVNDEQFDPLTLALPTSTPLEGSQKVRYMSSSLALRAQLERAGEMTLAAME